MLAKSHSQPIQGEEVGSGGETQVERSPNGTGNMVCNNRADVLAMHIASSTKSTAEIIVLLGLQSKYATTNKD